MSILQRVDERVWRVCPHAVARSLFRELRTGQRRTRRRHGGWYAELISAKGQETADGSTTAAMVVRYRLDAAPVIVDVGGYGGGVTIRLKDNGIEPVSFVASWESIEKTKDGQLAFANKRAEVWWKFREALDPDQPDGSAIALPPDPELRADLCAPTWKLGARGILLESKDGSSGFGNLRQRLGTLARQRRCGCHGLVGRQCRRRVPAQRPEMGETASPMDRVNATNLEASESSDTGE